MGWELSLYSLPPLLAAAIAVPVGVETWRHRSEPAAQSFLAVVAVLFVWSTVYGIQLGYESLQTRLFWQQLSLVVSATIPPVWLVFALRYAGLDEYITRRSLLLLTVDPLVYTAFVFTNDRHDLVWTAVTADSGPGLHLSFGIGYYVHIAYAYALVTAGIAVLAWVAADSTTVHRKQSAVLLLAASVPFGANIAFTLGASPVSGLDLTTFAFALSVSLIALAMFRLDLLDIVPIARRLWINQLGDGVIVIDTEGRVVELNTIAKRALDPTPAVGEPIGDSLPGESPAAADGGLLQSSVDGERRFYDIRYTKLTDHRGEAAGSLVGLRDVTDRTQYERRLEVANRVLRHNFRNAMNVVQGHATSLAEELEGEHAERARVIERRATEVIDLNEGIQQIAATLDRDGGENVVVDAGVVTETVAERVGIAYPSVEVVVDVPGSVRVSVADRDLLRTAIEHVVENAAEYNDAADPWIRVTVGQVGDRVEIRVTDNGPGIPEEERKVLDEGRETPLAHGSGIGLWLVSWVVTASGGDLSFGERDPRGTVVTLSLLAAKE